MSLPHRRTSVRRRARRTTGERTARAPLRRGRASTRDLHFDDVRDGLVGARPGLGGLHSCQRHACRPLHRRRAAGLRVLLRTRPVRSGRLLSSTASIRESFLAPEFRRSRGAACCLLLGRAIAEVAREERQGRSYGHGGGNDGAAHPGHGAHHGAAVAGERRRRAAWSTAR